MRINRRGSTSAETCSGQSPQLCCGTVAPDQLITVQEGDVLAACQLSSVPLDLVAEEAEGHTLYFADPPHEDCVESQIQNVDTNRIQPSSDFLLHLYANIEPPSPQPTSTSTTPSASMTPGGTAITTRLQPLPSSRVFPATSVIAIPASSPSIATPTSVIAIPASSPSIATPTSVIAIPASFPSTSVPATSVISIPTPSPSLVDSSVSGDNSLGSTVLFVTVGAVGGLVAALSILVLIAMIVVCVKRKQGIAHFNTNFEMTGNEAYVGVREVTIPTSQNEAYGTAAHNIIAVSENEAYSAVNELRDEITTSQNEAYGDQAAHEYDYVW